MLAAQPPRFSTITLRQMHAVRADPRGQRRVGADQQQEPFLARDPQKRARVFHAVGGAEMAVGDHSAGRQATRHVTQGNGNSRARPR